MKKYDYVFFQHRGKTLADYDTYDDPIVTEVFNTIAEYIEHIDQAVSAADGLTLVGPPGTGKTMLACVVLNAAVDAGYSVDAITLSDFVGLFHDQFRIGRDLMILKDEIAEEDLDRYNAVNERLHDLRCDTKVVLFDDIGKEYDSGSGWSNSQFDRFLRTRRNLGLTTLLTSNTELNKEWEERYGEAMESFLYEATTVMSLPPSPDRRRVLHAAWRYQ